MKIISVCNGKGGVGKTTTSAHIGAAIAHFGKKVLLIDLDSNKSLTGFFKIEIENFEDPITAIEVISKPSRFTFTQSHIEVSKNLFMSPVKRNEANTYETVFRNTEGALLNLKTALAKVSEVYDYVIIDTPGNTDSVYLKMAVAASHQVIIPIGPSDMDIEPTMAFLDILDETIQEHNPSLTDIRFLATKMKTKAQKKIILSMFDDSTKDQLFETEIGHRVIFERTSMNGITIIESNRKDKGAIEYMNLAKEVMI